MDPKLGEPLGDWVGQKSLSQTERHCYTAPLILQLHSPLPSYYSPKTEMETALRGNSRTPKGAVSVIFLFLRVRKSEGRQDAGDSCPPAAVSELYSNSCLPTEICGSHRCFQPQTWASDISPLQNPASTVSSLELTASTFSPNLLLLNVQLEVIFPYPFLSHSLFTPRNRCFPDSLGWESLTGQSLSVSGPNEMRGSAFQCLGLLFKPSPISSGRGKGVLIMQIQPNSKCQILRLLERRNVFCWS